MTLNRNVQDRSASFLPSGRKIPSWRDGAFLKYLNECFENFIITAMLTSNDDKLVRLHNTNVCTPNNGCTIIFMLL